MYAEHRIFEPASAEASQLSLVTSNPSSGRSSAAKKSETALGSAWKDTSNDSCDAFCSRSSTVPGLKLSIWIWCPSAKSSKRLRSVGQSLLEKSKGMFVFNCWYCDKTDACCATRAAPRSYADFLAEIFFSHLVMPFFETLSEKRFISPNRLTRSARAINHFLRDSKLNGIGYPRADLKINMLSTRHYFFSGVADL